MHPVVWLGHMLLNIYSYVLLAWVIIGILMYFNVVNRYNVVVSKISQVLQALVDPPLRYIRRYIPPISGVDLSPLILFIIIEFLSYLLRYYFA